MHVVTHLPGEGEEAREECFALLTLLARIWARHLSRPWKDKNGRIRPPLPPLYQTEVRYQEEPNSGSGFEQFDSPWQVFERGHGDCDDLVAWRLAELIARGVKGAKVEIVRGTGDKSNRMHARLKLPNGATDDPSIRMLREESKRRTRKV